jgi:hypothetical protein
MATLRASETFKTGDCGHTVAVAAANEPIVASYTKDQVAHLVGDAGFSDVELLDADALGDRYLRDRAELPIPNSTVTAIATV